MFMKLKMSERQKEATLMIKHLQSMRPGLAFLAVAFLSVMPAIAAAQSQDSDEFSGFLAQAKSEAVQVQQTAEEMYTLRFSKISWQTQAEKLEVLKTHVNKLGEFVVRMNNVEAPSPWQRHAIRNVTPMVEELAADVTMAIYHLDESRDSYVSSSFPEYVAANAELSVDIAGLLSDYVEYSEAKRTVEDIEFELELPIS
jgi:hypothetical protein